MVLLLVGAFVVGMGLVVFWTEPMGVLGVLERLTPNIVYRVRTKLPLVALSFDDGPHPAFTPQVLEILKRHEAKATFFLIGERALRYPEVVARIRAEGHEIGFPVLTDWAKVWRAYGARDLCTPVSSAHALG
jgi:peptidoglycan/xylan/chitin deacetylase (PgdA/CDA1 family)